MDQTSLKLNLAKLRQKLRRLQVASWSAIEQGDYRAVARFTCEAARLRDILGAADRI